MLPLAHFALFAWPLVAVYLFARLPAGRALLATIIGGYLLLPENIGYNLPALPRYDKSFAPTAAAFAMCLALGGRKDGEPRNGWLPRNPVILLLLGLYLFSPLATTLLNTDRIRIGFRGLPGLSFYDGLAFVNGQLSTILVFLMAYRLLSSVRSQRDILIAFAAAGLVYSFPVLLEVRLSPQLHNWIYGFTHFNWRLELRTGFRPVVFLNAGLWTAIFMAMSLIAMAGLWKLVEARHKVYALAGTVWLFLTLALSSSLGALFIGAVYTPIARFMGSRLQLLTAAGVALTILFYPMLRSLDVVPVGAALEWAEAIDARRAGSLQFRVEQEDQLLARANRRPLFGWGGWGRNRVYNEETGANASTTDGRWVILFGTYGWVGYIAEYGLLTAPILMLALRRRRLAAARDSTIIALVLNAVLIDMLLNDTLTPVVWLLAGGLLAYVERSSDVAAPAAEPGAPARRGPRIPVVVGAVERRRAGQ
jgi:hypothetical protein